MAPKARSTAACAGLLMNIPTEVMILIISSIDDVPSLLRFERTCRRAREVVGEQAVILWERLIRQRLPLWAPTAIAPSKALWRDIVRGEVPALVLVVHCFLIPNLFGSAFVSSVTYAGEDCDGGVVVVASDGADGSLVPAARARPALHREDVDGALLVPPTFLAFSRHEPVELQWKTKGSGERFHWWFAIVDRIVSDDVIVLHFPQYELNGSGYFQTEEGVPSHERIRRGQLTDMHGGWAGGLRPIGPAVLRHWLTCLAFDDLDTAMTLVHAKRSSSGGRLEKRAGAARRTDPIFRASREFRHMRRAFVDNLPPSLQREVLDLHAARLRKRRSGQHRSTPRMPVGGDAPSLSNGGGTTLGVADQSM